jgi:drug/metabolite transporter (DMT)-like permease
VGVTRAVSAQMLGDPKWGVLGPMQIGAFRFFLQAFFCTCIIVKSRVPWRPNSRKVAALLVIRGVFGTAGMLCFFYALTHMTISNATVLVFTNPIFTTVLGAVVRVVVDSSAMMMV